MSWRPVRDAYAAVAEQYIDLFDGTGHEHREDASLVRRHLTGLRGPVLDLGCGPGHWTADLHARGADVTGIDLVPEFVAHARAHHPGPIYRLGSMTDLGLPDHTVAGVLTWYSTIHLPPTDLARVLGAHAGDGGGGPRSSSWRESRAPEGPSGWQDTRPGGLTRPARWTTVNGCVPRSSSSFVSVSAEFSSPPTRSLVCLPGGGGFFWPGGSA